MLFDWLKRFPVRIATAKLFNKYGGDKDNWLYSDVKFSLAALGYKSKKDMSWYFQNESEIIIKDIQSLCEWLLACEYKAYIKGSVWQHPLSFEKEQKGDCVDFTLWAWRRLAELGFNTELIVGERNSDGLPKQHAWVQFEKDKKHKMLIETVSKDRERMLYNFDSVKQMYIPWASVNNNFKFRLYGGYCSAIKRHNNWTF